MNIFYRVKRYAYGKEVFEREPEIDLDQEDEIGKSTFDDNLQLKELKKDINNLQIKVLHCSGDFFKQDYNLIKENIAQVATILLKIKDRLKYIKLKNTTEEQVFDNINNKVDRINNIVNEINNLDIKEEDKKDTRYTGQLQLMSFYQSAKDSGNKEMCTVIEELNYLSNAYIQLGDALSKLSSKKEEDYEIKEVSLQEQIDKKINKYTEMININGLSPEELKEIEKEVEHEMDIYKTLHPNYEYVQKSQAPVTLNELSDGEREIIERYNQINEFVQNIIFFYKDIDKMLTEYATALSRYFHESSLDYVYKPTNLDILEKIPSSKNLSLLKNALEKFIVDLDVEEFKYKDIYKELCNNLKQINSFNYTNIIKESPVFKVLKVFQGATQKTQSLWNSSFVEEMRIFTVHALGLIDELVNFYNQKTNSNTLTNQVDDIVIKKVYNDLHNFSPTIRTSDANKTAVSTMFSLLKLPKNKINTYKAQLDLCDGIYHKIVEDREDYDKDKVKQITALSMLSVEGAIIKSAFDAIEQIKEWNLDELSNSKSIKQNSNVINTALHPLITLQDSIKEDLKDTPFIAPLSIDDIFEYINNLYVGNFKFATKMDEFFKDANEISEQSQYRKLLNENIVKSIKDYFDLIDSYKDIIDRLYVSADSYINTKIIE